MKINTDSQKIKEVLTRSVENIYPNREALEEILKSGKKIRLYNGIDPTGKLHLGHLAVLRKLRQFQDLGHEVIVLIGDFTAMIGDPTDKMAARKPLSRNQVLENAKNYKKQIGKILDFKKSNVKFMHNEEWANKLKPIDLLKIFSHFTVARILERDMFQKRIQEGKDILLHEFVYPVFQAYDSVIMDVDLEIGGNDQTFNMLRGRDLMKKMKNKEKFVMTLKLLTDPTGKKMGKSEGNLVPLDEKPQEMFGKAMAWPDSLLEIGFELLTNIPLEKIKKTNPREAKASLAREIVSLCYDKRAAEKAEKEFDRIFKEKKIPTKISGIKILEKEISLPQLLVRMKFVSSKSEARRVILQKGVKINSLIESDWQKIIKIKKGMIIQVGKRKFAKII
jgi:tyrosyl-tRNA synthetase